MTNAITFRTSGTPHPNALELTRNVQPITLAKQSPLMRLDRLLGTIKEANPAIFSDYILNLEKRYKELSAVNPNSMKDIPIQSVISQYPILNEYPSLAQANLYYFFSLLDPPRNKDWTDETVQVPQRNQLRAVLCPKYQNLLVLTEVIGRSKAFDMYKKYHLAFSRENRISQEDRFQTLEEFSEQWFQGSNESRRGLVRHISQVRNGKLYLRKDTCLWNDAIGDLQDVEIKYHICCFGDFYAAERANRHFILTMERTIVEGHPYCDSVFHDTRIDEELTHPSDEFFSNIRIDE